MTFVWSYEGLSLLSPALLMVPLEGKAQSVEGRFHKTPDSNVTY